jgi:hypothetical protein
LLVRKAGERFSVVATRRKVAGSRPDEVNAFFFNLPNPSSRAMALESTQSLTEMSTRKCYGIKRGRRVKLYNLAICKSIV